jgi:hypothetical protein
MACVALTWNVWAAAGFQSLTDVVAVEQEHSVVDELERRRGVRPSLRLPVERGVVERE